MVMKFIDSVVLLVFLL